jgi:hypothetical protein
MHRNRSFQELKGKWWREYQQSQGKAFEQQKGTWFDHAYKNWEALEQCRAQYKEIKELKARMSQMFELFKECLPQGNPLLTMQHF